MSSVTGGGGSIPEQPPFNPIKIPELANKALNQDISRYNSYVFPLFPGMSALRDREIQDAYSQLTSPLSPEFQNEFLKNSTVAGQAATGGGDLYSGMGTRTGSFTKGAESASYTRQALAKQDYDRARFDSLTQANPLPGLGLSQNDILSLYTYNTGAQNAANMGNYANQISNANAQFASQQAMWGSIGNLISGLGNTYTNYNMNSGFGSDYGQGIATGGGVG